MRQEITENEKKLAYIKFQLILDIFATRRVTRLSDLAFIFKAVSLSQFWTKLFTPHRYAKQRLREFFASSVVTEALGENKYTEIKSQLQTNKKIIHEKNPELKKTLNEESRRLIYFLIITLRDKTEIDYHHPGFSNITLLHIIIYLRNHQLLDEALSLDAIQKIGGSDNLTPLWIAAKRGNQEAVQKMLGYLSNSNILHIKKIINHPYAINHIPHLNIHNPFRNLLCCATFSGNLALIKSLINQGAEMSNSKNKIIQLAFLNETDSFEVIEFFLTEFKLQFGDVIKNWKDYLPYHPLILAAASGNKNLLEKLLEKYDGGDLPEISVREYIKLMKTLNYFDNYFNNWDILLAFEIYDCFKTIDLSYIVTHTPYRKHKESNKAPMKKMLEDFEKNDFALSAPTMSILN